MLAKIAVVIIKSPCRYLRAVQEARIRCDDHRSGRRSAPKTAHTRRLRRWLLHAYRTYAEQLARLYDVMLVFVKNSDHDQRE